MHNATWISCCSVDSDEEVLLQLPRPACHVESNVCILCLFHREALLGHSGAFATRATRPWNEVFEYSAKAAVPCGSFCKCLSLCSRCRLKVKEGLTGRTLTTDKFQADTLRCMLDATLQEELQGILPPKNLPRKFLPPGKRSDLYHLYLSSCMSAGAPVASISTFYRAFHASGYDRILKFRHKTQHTQCAICHRLKAAIAHSSDFVEHAKFCDEYHRHLAGMFADRKVYASLRARAACQQAKS